MSPSERLRWADTSARSARREAPSARRWLIGEKTARRGFTHLVALYAAMAQIGTEGNLGYLVPRVALSLATTAVWSVFCALSFLAPWAASARARDALAIAGLAAAVLLVAVSAG